MEIKRRTEYTVLLHFLIRVTKCIAILYNTNHGFTSIERDFFSVVIIVTGCTVIRSFSPIHMNTFSDPRCHGMQLFYSDNDPTSAELAEHLREANRLYLQPDNTRACKAADASIYLLDRAVGTAVLAECGFLSNPGDAAHLMTAEYREQTAAVLCIGILNYLSNQKELSAQ